MHSERHIPKLYSCILGTHHRAGTRHLITWPGRIVPCGIYPASHTLLPFHQRLVHNVRGHTRGRLPRRGSCRIDLHVGLSGTLLVGSFSWPGDLCRSCPAPPPGRVVSCPASDFSIRDQQRLSITVLKVSKTCPLILPSQFLPTHQSVTLFDHRFVPRLQYFLQPQPDLSAPSILGTGHGRRETNRKRSAAGLPSCNPQSFSQGQGHLHRAALAWHGLALRMPLPTKRAARCIVCSPPWMEISLAPFRAVDIQNLYGSDNLGCCNIGQRAHFVLGHTRKTVSSSSKRWLMMRDLLLV